MIGAGRGGGALIGFLLFLVVAIGVALRVYAASAFPFEQDEVYTRIEATFLFASPLHPGIEARPLYFLLEHVLLKVLPPGAFWLRLPALLFGVLGLVATWWVAKQFAGARTALVAAALTALSPWHLQVSGMARYWSLLYLVAVLSSWALWRAYATDRASHYLRALAFFLVGTSVHPSFMFTAVGAAAGVTLVTAEGSLGWRWPTRRGMRWLWVPYAGTLLLALGVLQLTDSSGNLRNWAGRDAAATLRIVPAIVVWMTPTLAAAAVAGAFLGWREAGVDGRRWRGIAVGGGVTTVLAVAMSGFLTNAYADYAVGMLPLAIICAAGFVAAPGGRQIGRGYGANAAVFLVVVSGLLPSTVSHFVDGSRFDYRWAFRRVEAERPAAAVLTWPRILQLEYAPGLRGFELLPRRSYLDSTLAREHGAWAVTSIQRYGIVKDPDGVVSRWLSDRCRLVEGREGHRVDYRRFRVELHWCNTVDSAARK